ncbi:IS3 family transposase [Atopobiaceae bacterium HCP3S3_D6]
MGASGNERSLPRKGRPYDNSAGGATNETLKAEPVYGESFPTLHELQVRPNDYVRRYSHFRLRSRLGYVSPVEFGNAGLSL